jgi:high-affinity iron transporter
MLPSFLLSLREGLEAALIIGIVLSTLNKLNRQHLRPVIWQGVGLAVVLSVLFGLGLQWIGVKFEGRGEEIFEGIAMLLAAGVLTWMILWMQKQGRFIKQKLEQETSQASQVGGKALLFLAFIAVFREGIELALFLLAASFAASGVGTLAGALLGLAAAVVFGWILIFSTRRLSLRRFFQTTNVLLILFAAGLVGLGVHELIEAGLVPGIVEHVWDINHLLSDQSELGLLLKALFGYNGNPALTEVFAYATYFVILSANFVRFQRRELLADTSGA